MNEPLPSVNTNNEPSTAGAAVPFFVAVLLLVFMVFGIWTWWRVQTATANRNAGAPILQLAAPLKHFELTERSGETFRSTDMEGKVWVVSYFFASCPGPCLRLNENIEQLNQLPDLKDVTWVSITCDPDNDTLEVLRNYADRWHADPRRWLFCRADMEYLQRVARGMNLALYWKTHSDHAVVIDKTGTIRGMFDATSKYECGQMRTLLRECLAETPAVKETAGETAAAG
jgi:cytochrome oxidase Cu insertion factor (SCO1/SenC/PrrC family)